MHQTLGDASEQESKAELNQARIRSRGGSGYDTKILVAGRTTDRVWRGELSAVEEIKEFSAELESQSLIGSQFCSFKDSEVKIVDPLGT